jgi:hypothetical protein
MFHFTSMPKLTALRHKSHGHLDQCAKFGMKRLGASICLWFAAASLLSAQSAGPPPMPLQLRLVAFQPSQATDEVFLHDPAATEAANGVQLPMKSYLNHEFVSANLKSRKLVLTKTADSSSLKNPDQWIAEATLPEKLRSAVLICLPEARGAKTPFRVLVVDDSKKAFPAGSFHVTNLSPSQVRIELEKRPWVIKPGATELIVDPPVRHGNLSGMKTYVLENQNWRRIASGIWPHPGRERVIQLFYYHPVIKQVQLRAFDDVPPRETDPPPQS